MNLSEEVLGTAPDVLTPLPSLPLDIPAKSEVLDALYNIETTPFENSFLSRIHGVTFSDVEAPIAVDWETKTPWMNLMNDIREHYSYAQYVIIH